MKATLALDPRYLWGCLCGENRKAENIIAILGHHFVFLSHGPKCKHLNIYISFGMMWWSSYIGTYLPAYPCVYWIDTGILSSSSMPNCERKCSRSSPAKNVI